VALTQEQIEKFVAAWYYALDIHAPVEELTRLVSDTDVHIEFPDSAGKYDLDGFKKWFDRVINIFFDENHNVVSVKADIHGDSADLDVVVAWQASFWAPPAAKSKRTSMDATQKWKVRASNKNAYGVEITYYLAAPAETPFNYAPGFARL
jgi:hypothetical protein